MSEENLNVVLDEAAKEVKEAEQEQKEEVAKETAQQEMAEAVFDPNAPIITLKKLLEAGVHYGHQTRK